MNTIYEDEDDRDYDAERELPSYYTDEGSLRKDARAATQAAIATQINAVAEEQESDAIAPTPQATLISYLISHPDAWVLTSSIIKPEYFDQQFQPVISYIFTHTEKYHQIPGPEMIAMETGIHIRFIPNANDHRTLEWIKDRVESHCRLQAMRQEIIRAALKIKDDHSRSTMEAIYKNVKDITLMTVHRNLGVELHRDGAKLMAQPEIISKSPTGYTHFDEVTNGGLPHPGMVIFAGKAGFGKTVTLINFSINKARQGKNVVYITLELSVERIVQRMSAAMTDIPTYQVRSRAPDLQIMYDGYVAQGNGRIYIEKMRMSGTTVTDIYAYIRELEIRENITIDVLCLDYLDLLHPKTTGIKLGDIHLKDKYVSEELYDLATVDRKLTIATASQLVKESEEKGEFDQSRMSGGTPKANTTDYLVFIDRKYGEDRCTFFISKGRDGGEGMKVPLKWNKKTLRISDQSDDEFFAVNPSLNRETRSYSATQTGKSVNTGTSLGAQIKAARITGVPDNAESFGLVDRDLPPLEAP